jgi:uncharacterized CHY-type Zn-finger protein
MSKKYLTDEQNYKIALMRRNDGDAVSQHAAHVGKAFACRRAAMQLSQHIAREVRTTMSERKRVICGVATARSRLRLLLAQTKPPEQGRRVKQHKHSDIGRRTCCDMDSENNE